ncbi:MAG: proline--tRNA ligase [Rhodoglobus sp.]
MAVLTSQEEDFPQWYQDVLSKAKLAENGPARGTMVIRPNGYAIWERMQAEVDLRIKKVGVQNAYFPLLIPLSYLEKEADHIEGFSPELAVVTHGGGKKLTESLAIRPTSETVIGEYMAKWVSSYRDLPLLLNQWANVVRWELRSRLFLRTTEFLWQEGHTAHATQDDAKKFAVGILHNVYGDFMRNVLAIPVIVGRKTPRERFAGAMNTMSCEGIMRDGKALQMSTSHELGQNFSTVFDMTYSDAAGANQLCWTTSWGSSTRMIGGLIMGHGDDDGLVLPPALAPIQVVSVVVKDTDGRVRDVSSRFADQLAERGIRSKLDDNLVHPFGRRATDWDLQGVPLRLDIGPRDVEEGVVVVFRRDTREKKTIPISEAVDYVIELLPQIQQDMLSAATARRDSQIVDCTSIDEVRKAARTGVARVPWSVIGESGETELAADAFTVRCLQRPDGSLPEADDEPGIVAYVARAY